MQWCWEDNVPVNAVWQSLLWCAPVVTLACSVAHLGSIKGKILVNGAEVPISELRTVTGFVPQVSAAG